MSKVIPLNPQIDDYINRLDKGEIKELVSVYKDKDGKYEIIIKDIDYKEAVFMSHMMENAVYVYFQI